ncbi:helix-turn-helix domain-containing protein [Candidatus Erwinia dacicola]|nr:helix-turn-helix domain-containing protein [Candidatus Erwinia dacicola]
MKDKPTKLTHQYLCNSAKHLTQKERFYIEKRRGEGLNQATIARELDLPCSTI